MTPLPSVADVSNTSGASAPSASPERRRSTARSAPGRSPLFTTTRSADSSSPAFIACTSSPPSGPSTNRTRSASRTMPRSAWPAPTVSIKRRSNPAASISSDAAAAACESERPLPRVAMERMKRPSSSGRSSTRTRSPSSAPPLTAEEGSTARIATRRPSSRARSASAPTSVLFPAPGGPVTPITRAAGPVAVASWASAS